MSHTIQSVAIIWLFIMQIGTADPLNFPEDVNEQSSRLDEVKCIKTDDWHNDLSEQPGEMRASEAKLCHLCGDNFDRLLELELDCGHAFHEHCIKDWLNDLIEVGDISKISKQPHCKCPVCGNRFGFTDELLWEQYYMMLDLLREHWGVIASARPLSIFLKDETE